MWPKHVLMVTPEHFEIAYAINPHMVDKGGELKRIDKTLAWKQWNQLKTTFETLGLQVSVFEGQPHLPDMVFCANPIFPFLKNNRTEFVCSNMLSPFRRNEVEYFARHINKNNHELYKLPEKFNFEAMGDALWNYETGEIFGGYGFRTDIHAYEVLEQITGAKVIRLKLINETFYHTDTALCIVDKDTALVVAEAFNEASLETLRLKFKNIIWVPIEEAQNHLAANACSVDGHHVIVEKNAPLVRAQLQKLGYSTHVVDTSEYVKSGGSLFCMKLMMWDKLENFETVPTPDVSLEQHELYSFL